MPLKCIVNVSCGFKRSQKLFLCGAMFHIVGRILQCPRCCLCLGDKCVSVTTACHISPLKYRPQPQYLATRASNEGLRRFHNHGDGSYYLVQVLTHSTVS